MVPASRTSSHDPENDTEQRACIPDLIFSPSLGTPPIDSVG